MTAGVILFGVGGALNELGVDGLSWVDLGAEGRGAAKYSAALLLMASLAGVSARYTRQAGRSAMLLGLLFAFMALDEYYMIHEELERLTRVDWQVLYLPVVAALAACFIHMLWLCQRDRSFVAMWVSGAAAWLMSQILEQLQWDGDIQRSGYAAMMVCEEILEMSGSVLLGLALWRWVIIEKD
ncbi:hypothetical protein O2W15_18445 [Modestobacter sp. VKM Ac-2979]|uniref:hypothetical protein n=1 Tax=unclassified Modestobacter TaxID=2643866 RepID=UPI0022AB70FF|nr:MULTISPECIES: hypothetical protein [unclassified Modestobacter]MCZ2813415.1 hypothetical protein [Modestobacter sp. VKM Ac-2979]MCZ2842393.1 hypothetical protein [Modestobacter sp. VKM Ac-2980]